MQQPQPQRIHTEPLLCRGITGGVESFPQFLKFYFPDVQGQHGGNFYCRYNSRVLSTYSGETFLSGIRRQGCC